MEKVEKYSFIIEFDEITDKQINNLTDYFSNNEIKFHVLKSDYELKKQQEIIDKINNYLDNYDVFKVFNFPLMKKWEEQEVKSSIDYEFKTSLIKDLKEILEDKEETDTNVGEVEE